MSPRAKVTFNLEDATLPELVRLISQITGKRFIMPGKSRTISATIYAPTKVTAAEAYRAFLSILQINGMTVVPAGRYLKLVETAGIENNPVPTYTDGIPRAGDDRYITQMYRLQNVSAEDIANLLGKFKTKEGNVTAYAPTNTLIVTDTAVNIRRMMRIVRTLDVSRSGEQLWIEPVHHAAAADIAKVLEEIFPTGKDAGKPGSAPAQVNTPAFGGGGGASGSFDSGAGGNTPSTVGSSSKALGESRVSKILADERTNALIILATERAYLRILELLRELDKPQEGDGRVHVHYLQHAEAEELSTTLSTLTGGSTGTPSGRGAPPAGGGGGGGDQQIFEGQIKVTASKASNALLITASLHDYAALRKVIERLDAPRRQVFIEAVILELGVQRGSRFGVSWHGGVPNVPSTGSLSLFGFQAQNSLSLLNQDALTSLAVGVRGPTIDESQSLIGASIPAFGVALAAIANSSDANVLSTPHILATDNQEAEITVGENVPLQTSAGGLGALGGLGAAGATGAAGQANPAAGLAGLAALGGGLGGGFGVAPRQDVGTSIKITPHVNESEEVRLDIAEEISELQGRAEGALGVRTIAKRTAKTKLSVKDQQTIVIGGLIRDATLIEKTKIPILGDIPLLGALFRRTETTKRKTNLLLILTPYIIRSPADVKSIYERKMRERQDFLDRYFVFNNDDYEPPLDYSRTRGLLSEISNEFAQREAEQRLLEESLRNQPPPHTAHPPVGVVPEEPVPDEEPDGSETIEPPEGDVKSSETTGTNGTTRATDARTTKNATSEAATKETAPAEAAPAEEDRELGSRALPKKRTVQEKPKAAPKETP